MFLNYTEDALRALGVQLSAASRMAWQNRQVLDCMLAKENGVCDIFEEKGCTFIPNHTEPGGEFYNVMNKLKGLREELAENSRIEPWSVDGVTGWLNRTFGQWGSWFIQLGVKILAVLIVVAMLACCIFLVHAVCAYRPQ